ncbi:hypothetical protein GCM10011418_44210 [Sphingobacterium alkalisoli]|nr:hypothetical protein GCM10011418_44210 [Sphingobacterium alkalisoli]
MLLALTANGQSNVFPTSGNVGIGTTNPLARLQVKGDVMFERLSGGNNYVLISGASNGSFITSDDPGTNHKNLFIRVAPTGDNATDRHLFFQTGKVNGEFQTRFYIAGNGNVGIGTTSPTTKLSVNGNIRAKEIKVETANWPDYVFQDEYEAMSLPEIEQFIKQNGHLPEIPSASEVEKEGISLGEMNKLLLKKIEELTLLLIEKNREIEYQGKEITEMKDSIKQVKNWIEKND